MLLDASIGAAPNTCVGRSQQKAKLAKGIQSLSNTRQCSKVRVLHLPISPAHLTRISSWILTVDSSAGSQADTELRGWVVFMQLLLHRDFNGQLSAMGKRAVLDVRVLGLLISTTEAILHIHSQHA